MTLSLFLLIAVIIVALAFDYINGFHDCANSIASVVSTKVLSPRQAVLFGAVLEASGALLGVNVAKTIGAGIIASDTITLQVILCALLTAVVWNLITWWFGLPSSSSHALIGGLLGSAFIHAGLDPINFAVLIEKVIIPMFASPVVGFVVGFAVMCSFLRLFYKMKPDIINRRFKRIQVFASGLMALSHGLNDAQKTMGVITMALVTGGVLVMPEGEFNIPIYVKIVCAVTMAMGTMTGGWKIIKTMGSKIIKLKPISGAAADFSASSIVLIASIFGIPLSTTHVVSTSIMGVGTAIKGSAVKTNIIRNIVTAWVLTIPCCVIMSVIIYSILKHVPH
ncbi:MAG: inorganic phosphate transporter [Candidatus Gastranaerophilales bacterium]|nr:inorganic phosphate transporter [Candidatus Gastranaerophilales bacterium]